MQLYIMADFSLPTQGSFFLIHVGDGVGAGYRPHIMPRSWVKIVKGPIRLIKGGPGALVSRGT